MPNIELTDDQMHWVAVAIETAKERAKTYIGQGVVDEDDMDVLTLIHKYDELQEIFPEPGAIGLQDAE